MTENMYDRLALHIPYVTSSYSSIYQRLCDINVERSPALRKLMKQDEISEPVQRTTTRTSVQSSPWDVRTLILLYFEKGC